jgi:ABC-type uncharacterized transport system substrate-binding protein
VPNAIRIAVLVNPANAQITETTVREVSEATRNFGLQIQVLNASTSREIEDAFAGLRDRADALFVGPDIFFNSQRANGQIARHRRAELDPIACRRDR